MAYHVTVIETNGDIAEFEYEEVPSLKMLRDWVGGYIESVPYWDKHGDRRAWVICNEEGKLHGLPFNIFATMLWYDTVGGAKRVGGDTLVGNIVIIACDTDEEFRQL